MDPVILHTAGLDLTGIVRFYITCRFVRKCASYHVFQVNEGIIHCNNLDAFLEASPQDQTANATETADGESDNY